MFVIVINGSTHEYMHLQICQSGWTPLLWAARDGRLPMVEYLVEKGAVIETKNNVSDVHII